MSACRKLSCLSSCKKSYLSFTSFLKYYKDITNLFIWYFGYAWSRPQQTIVAKKKTLWCLFMDGVQLHQGYRVPTRRQSRIKRTFIFVFKKIKLENIQKMQNTLFDTFLPKFGKKRISTRIGLRHFLASTVP